MSRFCLFAASKKKRVCSPDRLSQNVTEGVGQTDTDNILALIEILKGIVVVLERGWGVLLLSSQELRDVRVNLHDGYRVMDECALCIWVFKSSRRSRRLCVVLSWMCRLS